MIIKKTDIINSVSVDWESGRDLARQFWLRVSIRLQIRFWWGCII